MQLHQYSAGMSDSAAAQQPSSDDKEAFNYHAGHYAVAVANQLLKDGIPVAHFDVDLPGARDGEVDDGEVWMFFSREFRHRISPTGDASLDWNEVSGWSLERELSQTANERRYLGHGLTPDPERVSVFVSACSISSA
jgi:hypothetical protein